MKALNSYDNGIVTPATSWLYCTYIYICRCIYIYIHIYTYLLKWGYKQVIIVKGLSECPINNIFFAEFIQGF